jgi:branched-chain amino acid transport system substrate-binding protein
MERLFKVMVFVTVLCLINVGSGVGAETIRVGMVGPLSGPVAVYGNDVLRGIKFALDHINKSRMLGNYEIELISADNEANPGLAAQAARRMIDRDKVMVLLGGSTSAGTQAMIEVTRPSEVLQVSPLALATELTLQGNPWFVRICQSASMIAAETAEWVVKTKKVKRPYTLVRNDPMGQSLAKSYTKKLEELLKNYPTPVVYEPNLKDFKPILSRISEVNPDFVVVHGFYTDTALIRKQMAEMGINLPFFAGSAVGIPQYAKIAGPAAEGSYGTLYFLAGTVDSDAGRRFYDTWKKEFKRDPGQYEGMGYDVLMVTTEAIKRAIANKNFSRAGIKDAMHTIENYPGATGEITIVETGDVRRPMPFVRLVDGKLKLECLAR